MVAIVTQRRRNRPLVAMQVAPKCPRPQALRELYLDAGSLRMRGKRAEEETAEATSSTSR